MTEEEKNDLRDAVATLHGCDCLHLRTTQVHEMMEGQTVWKGQVEVFKLIGHPKADKAYAWFWVSDSGEKNYIAVLHIHPINSPRKAVQAAIVSGGQR